MLTRLKTLIGLESVQRAGCCFKKRWCCRVHFVAQRVSGLLVLSLCIFIGCQSKDEGTQNYGDTGQSQQQEHDHNHASHEHGHGKGPNGGHLLELGDEEYHAEFVFDPETKKTTLHITGKDYHVPHPINAEEVFLELKVGDGLAEVPFMAVPLEGEKDGRSSRFELPGDQLPEGISSEEDFNGMVHVAIGDKAYSAKITHQPDTDAPEKEEQPEQKGSSDKTSE